VLGSAFGAIVKSLVSDIIMPPIGLLLGNVDFTNIFLVLREGTTPGPYPSLEAARQAGAVTVNLGVFINTIVYFLIIAFSIFLVVKGINNMKRKEEAKAEPPKTKTCPYCFMEIPIKATRCPHCTAQLEAAGA